MGNEIDGPAIAWLAAQKGPRVWLFDGGATGSGDDACLTDEMRKELDYHQTTGRIQVLDPSKFHTDDNGNWDSDMRAYTARAVAAITKAMR